MSEKNINEESVTSTGMSRKAKRRMVSWVSIALMLIALILLNVIAGILTDRYAGLTADVTINGSFELSEDSIRVAESVKKDVTITFLTERANYEAYDTYTKQAARIADLMKQYSGGKINVEYIDLVKNPNLENQYQNETLSVTDVIVRCGEKYNIIKLQDMFNFDVYGEYQYITSSKAESALDTAVIKVTSDVETKIAILTDHTEDSYSTLESVLAANNYILEPISIEKSEIPEDITTVIAYAPAEDYSKEAVEKIKKYLTNDEKFGRNFIFIAYRYEIECPNITDLLSFYGMKLEDGLAFETDSSRMMVSGDAYRNIAAIFSNGELYHSNYKDNDLPVLVSMSRAVSISNENVALPLLQFSKDSGICPYSADENWDYKDYLSGYSIVMAQGVSGDEKAQSHFIFAGSTEMWNSLLAQSGFTNTKYILNILNAFSNREDNGVYLADKEIIDYDLSTVDMNRRVVTGVIIYAVIPVLILGAGICVFIVRRRK